MMTARREAMEFVNASALLNAHQGTPRCPTACPGCPRRDVPGCALGGWVFVVIVVAFKSRRTRRRFSSRWSQIRGGGR